MATTQTTTALQQGNLFAPKAAASWTTTANKPIEQRTRPYKDFLTPALHRRFTRAAVLVFAACYIISILISPPKILWFWNPLSFTGVRAFLLFIPCLFVFIVRVANMHVGNPTTNSTAQHVWRTATSWKMVHTLGWYVLSAFLFGEVYLWNQGPGANLGWIDYGKVYADGLEELPVLNENPILLRALWILLAVGQSIWHLSRDEDRLPVPEKELDEKKNDPASRLPKPLQELVDRLPILLNQSIWLILPVLVSILPLYWLFFQKWIWWVYAPLSGIFYSQLPADSEPTGLQHKWRLVFQAVTSSIFLTVLWELSSAVFTIYVCQPPLRREQPLTAEVKNEQGNVVSRSKDPNGSLLNGLKSRKEVTKAFALCELSLICENFEARRRTLYTEVDRKDGSTWTQICELCLAELEAVQKRILDAVFPVDNSPPAQEDPSTSQPLGLPKIADRDVVPNGDVLQRSKKSDLPNFVRNAAKSLGQSPKSAQTVQIQARKALEWSTDRIISKRNQDRFSAAAITEETNATLVSFLRTPVGQPFIHTFSRRVQAIIFGQPHSARTNIARASQALCILCMHSLKEDDYGQVARSIPTILRTYTDTITAITTFMAELGPHWTDVEFRDRDRRVLEVEELVVILKAGLEGVILAFGEYADAVGVTRKEMREAREAVGKGLEMRKV